eukprot:1890440-Rhodomonas_salina.1
MADMGTDRDTDRRDTDRPKRHTPALPPNPPPSNPPPPLLLLLTLTCTPPPPPAFSSSGGGDGSDLPTVTQRRGTCARARGVQGDPN